jgi:hypothetical protein
MAKSANEIADRVANLVYVVIVAFCVLCILEYTGILSGSSP